VLTFCFNWAKERIDEMDAHPGESKAAEMRAECRVKADQFIADLRKKRDAGTGHGDLVIDRTRLERLCPTICELSAKGRMSLSAVISVDHNAGRSCWILFGSL
jgi:hypothetical protein